MGVIEAAVTCHLPAYEAGLLKSLIFGAQLYLRHYQTVILAMKLIHLPCMNAVRGFNQIAGLVYNTRLTYQHQVLSILQGNLAFVMVRYPLSSRIRTRTVLPFPEAIYPCRICV